MHHFEYRDGVLHAEDVSIEAIAAEVGTPFYCYSTATLVRHYHVFADALAEGVTTPEKPLVCFSVKANGNQAVLRTLAKEGCGFDVVSGGELKRALAAGVTGEKIVFSGVGKTRDEMRAALEANIYQFNVESEPELEALNEVAGQMGVKAPITLRVNPDVDAKTHAKIATGKSENKFGIPWAWARDVYGRAGAMDHIQVVGIDVHIGSQLTSLEPFEAAFRRVAELVHDLREDGHQIDRLDLGGGLGIPYDETMPPHPDDYAHMVTQVVGNLGCRLIFEPGRMIAGNAGILVSDVIYVKDGENRKFVIIDAAMNDLIRPSLYEAHHGIIPVKAPHKDTVYQSYDIVGPVCETGDTFAKGREMAAVEAGDLIAFLSAGAYGAVMSSTYNARPLVPEVLVNGDKFAVIRPRPSVEDLIKLDNVPDWLTD